MELDRSRKRRRYSAELKAQILAECEAANASVAKVAMSHGINANIVHGWRKIARKGAAAVEVMQRQFVPVVASMPDARANEECIEVELRRGPLTMKIVWPLSAAADMAAWTRELLRIRVDAVWMAVEPLDMRAGTEAALAKVVAVFGAPRGRTMPIYSPTGEPIA